MSLFYLYRYCISSILTFMHRRLRTYSLKHVNSTHIFTETAFKIQLKCNLVKKFFKMIICSQDQKLLVFFLHVVLSYYCIVMCLKNKNVRCNFAPKFFELHAWFKKCHFGIFLEMTRMACPQKCIIAFENFFLFWVSMNSQKDCKAKLKSACPFKLTRSTHVALQKSCSFD